MQAGHASPHKVDRIYTEYLPACVFDPTPSQVQLVACSSNVALQPPGVSVNRFPFLDLFVPLRRNRNCTSYLDVPSCLIVIFIPLSHHTTGALRAYGFPAMESQVYCQPDRELLCGSVSGLLSSSPFKSISPFRRRGTHSGRSS